jgi:hypothetical protein
LLGFNPKTRFYDTGVVHLATLEEWNSTDPAPEHLLRLYDMYRGERRQEGTDAIALANALAAEKEMQKSNAHREKFNDGDLVLVRQFDTVGKMEPKWLGPRILTQMNPGGLSAQVRRLYDDRSSRYHLDDLRVYHKRNAEEHHYDQPATQERVPAPVFHVERTAMSDALLLGQRGFDLRWS